MENLEVASGFKIMTAEPLDYKLKVDNLFNPTGNQLDLSHYKTLFIGYGLIFDTATSAHYYVSGGNVTDGWIFDKVHRNRVANNVVTTEDIEVAGIGTQGEYSDGDIIPSGTSVEEILIKCLNTI